MNNWKTILGYILICGTTAEFIRITRDYQTGALEFWPFGVSIGAIFAIALGIFLVKKGRRKQRIK